MYSNKSSYLNWMWQEAASSYDVKLVDPGTPLNISSKEA